MTALELLHDAGRWSMDAVWLPLLIWTAVALPIYALQRWTPRVTYHTRYWTILALVVSLPIGLVAAGMTAMIDTPVREGAVFNLASFGPVITTSAPAASFVWTVYHSAGALLVVACVLTAVRGIILMNATVALRRFTHSSMDPVPAPVAREAARLARRLGVTDRLRICISKSQTSPLTFGWRNPMVVLPAPLLDAPSDLRLALAHELVHIRRRDYPWQWSENLIGALFAIHPLVTVLRREAAVLREITCDADVLAQLGERSRYARLLLQYSTASAPHGRLAVGILLRENHLKQRIRAMKDLLEFTRLSRSKRIGILLSATLLIVTVVAVACTDAFVDSTPNTNARTQVESAPAGDETFVIVEQMPELVGGLASIMQDLRYPEVAKNAGVSGRVIVQFIVDKDGNVVDPEVVRGVGSGLDEAALEAVRKAEFKPGMQRGEPVRVKMSLPVTFKLDGSANRKPGDASNAEVDAVTPAAANVDKMPELVGGLAALQQDLKYPELAKRAGVEGRVIVEFVVTKEGTTRDARIVRGLGSGLDEEALRVVRTARFTPALQGDNAVPMKLSLPFTFRLD